MSTVTDRPKKKRRRPQKVEPVVEPQTVDYPDPLEEELAAPVETPKPPETREEGVRCPKCHCRHCPVKYVKHYGKRTYRYRACRYCGHPFKEMAVVVGPEGS